MASGTSLPWIRYRTHSGASSRAPAATTPALQRRAPLPPASRAATLNAKTMARRPPVRATTIQIAGGMRSSSSENGANNVVKTTGSGFHDGPAVVSRERCARSRPHTSHAHGS